MPKSETPDNESNCVGSSLIMDAFEVIDSQKHNVEHMLQPLYRRDMRYKLQPVGYRQ